MELWQKVTDVKEDERGAALVLSMSGPALDIALAIDTDTTSVADLLTILDKVYIAENSLSLKFDEFDQLKRPKDQNMREFIHIYDQKANELKAENLILPDLVLANKLLRAANLIPEHYLLARSTCGDMTMANAKKALLRITEQSSGNSDLTAGSSSSSSSSFIKVENEDQDILYSEKCLQNHNEHYGHDCCQNEILYQNGKSRSRNPYVRSNSQKIQCFGCGADSHIIRDCPNRPNTNSNNNRLDTNRLCYGCGDKSHWIKDCPYLQDLQNLIKSQRFNKGRNTFIAENSENSGADLHAEEEIYENNEKPVFFSPM